MEYYQRLKELRIDKDISQKEIAAILGTEQSYYSKYEKGLRPIPVNHLKTLALYYGVSTDYILGLPRNLKWPR